MGLSVAMMPTDSKAITVDGAVKKIVDFASKQGSSKMCRKGKVNYTKPSKSIISIRSFKGLLCSASKSLAGFAIGTCYGPNTEKFRDSTCFKKAKAKLGLTDSMTQEEIVAKAVAAMAADIKKVGSPVQKMACAKASSLPGAAGKLAVAKCG